jgi:general secretion pathway protein F
MLVGMGLIVLLALAGWLGVAYAYYRHCMQQELLAVLAGGTRGGLPLHTAVRAFALDRPEPWMHRAWSHLALGLLLPGLNLLYGWWNYRRSLLGVADALEDGGQLSEVLRYRLGLVSSETVLAARVGEASGQLAETLEQAHVLRDRFGTLWIKLAVHLVYPVMLAILGTVVLWVQWQWVAPVLKDTVGEYLDAGMEVPRIAYSGQEAALGLTGLTAVLVLVVAVIVLVQVSSTLRWYIPGIAWYYRARMRAQVLEMLALLLRVGRPLPEAFGVLAAAPLGGEVRARLAWAARLASQGQSPGACLRRTGLAPRRWVALLQSAQQRGHLPWAMRELGESLHRRLQRRFQRVINVVCPLLVAVIGGTFAIGCFATMYPLIYLVDMAASSEWVF